MVSYFSTPGGAAGGDLAGTYPNPSVVKAANGFTVPLGQPLRVVSGANAKAGIGTLAAGTVSIATTAATANSMIFVTDTSTSGTNVGSLYVSSVTAGVGFTVKSSVALDASTFNWLIIESA